MPDNPQCRYRLSNDCKRIWTGKKTQIPVGINTLVFVDIFEKFEEGTTESVKIRAYFPDGNIVVGTVPGFCIEIHNFNSLFDGRFNSTGQLAVP